jgi:hypothetical protein
VVTPPPTRSTAVHPLGRANRDAEQALFAGSSCSRLPVGDYVAATGDRAARADRQLKNRLLRRGRATCTFDASRLRQRRRHRELPVEFGNGAIRTATMADDDLYVSRGGEYTVTLTIAMPFPGLAKTSQSVRIRRL